MKRIGAMAAVALIALLIALPLGLVAAQGDAPRANVPPAFIFGNAMADGLPVPEGTTIRAMAGDEKIGSTTAMQGGEFELRLMQPMDTDAMVTFMIGERMVDYLMLDERMVEEYMWESGDRYAEAVLSADLAAQDGSMGPPGADGAAGPPGVPGVAGADGAAGRDGRDGAAGADGPPGAQGEQGIAGPPGGPGAQGPAGVIGPAGSGGSMGIIALIVAIVAVIIAIGAIVMGRRTTA